MVVVQGMRLAIVERGDRTAGHSIALNEISPELFGVRVKGRDAQGFTFRPAGAAHDRASSPVSVPARLPGSSPVEALW
jgi:hypothetical protein